MSKILNTLKSSARIAVPLLIVLGLGAFGYLGFPWSVEWLLAHMGVVLLVMIFPLLRLGWALVNNQRKQEARDPKNKSIVPKPMLRPFGQAWRDWFDLTWMVDSIKRRIFNLIATVVTVAATVMVPFGRTAPDAPTITSFNDLSAGWSLDTPYGKAGIAIAIGMPLLWLAIIAFRAHSVTKEREGAIEMIYNISASCLKYPRKSTRVRPDEMAFQTPRGAIDVKKWKGLTDPEIFFVAAPISMDINDKEKWNTLQANLETKLPSDTGWHFEFDPRGKGATVMPASYPMSVLWDGEQDDDPLTFLLGADLDNPGEFLRFTFGETSPHSATVGGTGSGKHLVSLTIIATPNGFVKNEDLNIGDQLIDPEGNITNIIAFSDWVEKPIYRMHYSDGTFFDCSDTHRHVTYDRAARRSESRNKTERKRQGWLSDEAIAILNAEADTCDPTDHISLKELATLAGLNHVNKAIYDLADAIGASKEQTILKECYYAEQVVEQKQEVVVFSDRKETLTTLSAYYKGARNQNVRANALKVESLLETDRPDLTSVELRQVLDTDWSNISRTLQRAGIDTGVKEKRTVALKVPAKTVMKESGVINFYPRRDMCRELARMGSEPWHDQQHLRNMPKVRTTQEILDTLKVGEYVNHSVHVTEPVKYPERTLQCHPYVLGAWLGDGVTTAVRQSTTTWSSSNPEVLEELIRLGPITANLYKEPADISPISKTTVHLVQGFRDILPADAVRPSDKRKSGIMKQIPDAYMFASVEQRWALLQGLMDTDGSVNKEGNCEFYQSDKHLAQQVRSLVASLGMVATIHEKQGVYKDCNGDNVDCQVCYTVAFTPPPGAKVFRLERKQSRLDSSNDLRREYVNQHRYIVDVEVLPQTGRMRCIAVDSPTHQFLVTDQYVATHNTSVTEAIVAQAATKPMPWSDPSDPIYATIYIIDPKGPFANRWVDRPNITVVNGTRDTVNDDGDPISGIEAMQEMVDRYVDAMNERGHLIDSYGLAKWLDLPEEVLRRERLAPWFICLDEYLDHTDKITGKSEQAERDNTARQILTEKVLLVARKGRSFGFHIMLIAQMANMTVIGNALMRQLIARIIMGNMDAPTYQTFFGTTEVPVLPTTRVVDGKRKGIPGRGRIMNAPGQDIHRMQAFWFGGRENSDTLDKHLPRSGAAPAGPEMAEADIDDYIVDEHGPVVALTPENVAEETINDKPVPKPEPEESPAPAPQQPPKSPKVEVVNADDLFGEEQPEAPKPVQGKFEPCVVCETTTKMTKPCANPKCENYVCIEHHKSPDGVMWACPTCAKSHVLTKMRLGTLYPEIKSKAEKAGGTAIWSKKTGKVEVSVRVDNVEIVKITGSPEGVEGMDGNSVVNTPADIRKMVTAALK